MSILVISTSLSSGSRSALMAQAAFEHLQRAGESVEFIDLRETAVPLCDAGGAYGDANVCAIAEKLSAAKGVILAAPIYNYDISSSGKTLLELTGRSWTGKVVGLICAAGGMGSYMAPMAVASSLMLDFRCVIVPRFVYGTGQSFEGDQIGDVDLLKRIHRLAEDTVAFAKALDGLTEQLPE